MGILVRQGQLGTMHREVAKCFRLIRPQPNSHVEVEAGDAR